RTKTMAEPFKITRLSGTEALDRLTRRGAQPEPELPEHIRQANEDIFGRPMTAHEVVDQVVADVERDGDAAVRRYTELFDKRKQDQVEVPRSEWDRALNAIDPDLRQALEIAADRIRAFHERQVRQSWFET